MKYSMFPLLLCCFFIAYSQPPKTELYSFIKSFLYDSTGYENVGEWAVGNSKKFAVKWDADRIEMSEDTSINFFRKGKASIAVNSKPWPVENSGQWSFMLKGPRMGYSSFSMISPASASIGPRLTIDSIFKGKAYKATLIKGCDTKPVLGYYFYEVKMPGKDLAYLKISWITVNGKTAYRIDGYDAWSRRSAKFECR